MASSADAQVEDVQLKGFDCTPAEFRRYLSVSAVAYKEVKGVKSVLIVQRSPKSSWRPLGQEIPGGGVETGENILHALARELKEETGLEGKCIKLLKQETWHNEKKGILIERLVFLVKVDSAQVVKLSKEHCHYDWVTKDDMSSGQFGPLDWAEKHVLAGLE